jgi:hypothetical protein
MAIVDAIGALYSGTVSKKFGGSNGYGRIVFGFSYFGEDNELAGIYKTIRGKRGRTCVKMLFYRSPVQRTPKQAIQRDKYVAAVAAWKALTAEEKEAWNLKAQKKQFEKLPILCGGYVKKLKQKTLPQYRGYDIFRSSYLLTH